MVCDKCENKTENTRPMHSFRVDSRPGTERDIKKQYVEDSKVLNRGKMVKGKFKPSTYNDDFKHAPGPTTQLYMDHKKKKLKFPGTPGNNLK